MREETKRKLKRPLTPLVKILVLLSVPPNLLTFLSLLFAATALFFFARGNFLLGGISLIIISLLDTLDGEVARERHLVSSRGAFLDSVVDRFSEFLIFFGLFLHYQEDYLKGLVFLTLSLSFFVSYIRARAEGIGKSCRIGLFERPVRFFFLIIGSLFFPRYFPYFLFFLSLGSFFTILERIIYIWKDKVK